MEVMWDLITAINLARKMETIAEKYAMHVALGGGVLKRGASDKDVDIFVYPHGGKEKPNVTEFYKDLVKLGIKEWNKCDAAQKYNNDSKLIYMAKIGNKRIDIFFMHIPIPVDLPSIALNFENVLEGTIT